ncbi:response regulator transcription factor [Pseudomonas fluorescens]|uniref:Virulence factors putative positive transcription regulator BvgA n=1 Tax=Pseudomonas fluorescens TaxID=294 RepID=A0A5E7FE95_PSEFL|nr:response regulator transcription factor [Pseudomonas fluorescens]VVO37569.1 Virulence factors putative positive transcription regulator BvgA [Pseudomonas fluorescens]
MNKHSKTLKALVVDDHPVIRAAVKMVLQKERFQKILEACNGVEAVQTAKEHRPDLVVLDISMPRMDGLEVLSRLKDLQSSGRILVYTALEAIFYAPRCMRNGAFGYISKTNDLEELGKAVSAVMSGYTYFPQLSCSSVHLGDLHSTEMQLIEKLSDRELTIFQGLARGLNNKDIADSMHLSHKTISTYKTRLIEKLKVTSLVHLRDYAIRNHLI